MTPKELAEELYNEFFDVDVYGAGLGDTCTIPAAEYAIICVRRILYQYEYISVYLSPDWCNKHIDFFNEVIKELQTYK